jgi:hypothetical protein
VIDPADGTPAMISSATAAAVAGTSFTWQFSATANPAGYNIGELPVWLAFNPLTGALSGTPTAPGDSKFSVSAYNALGQGQNQQFVIHIAAAAGTPVVVPPSAAFTGRVGTPLTVSISASGSVDFFDATALPFGIALNSRSGVFSGSPVEPGTFKVNLWGVNAQGTGEPVVVTFAIQPAVGTPSFTRETIIRTVAGSSFSHTFSTIPSATLYAADDMPSGWSFNSGSGLLQSTPIAGTYNLALEAWNEVGSSGRTPFQIRVFSGPGALWKDQEFGEQAGDPNVSGWSADPDHDGVVNLLERAFNLDPNHPSLPILIANTGTTGLPLIRAIDGPDGRLFSIQYLRRKASTNAGLTYTPQFSSSLNGTWSVVTGTETTESIDSEWERVTVEDASAGGAKRFGRVKVSGE